MKFKLIIIFVLIVAAFGAGIYFKDDAVKFYNSFNRQVQSFQKTDIGVTLTQVGKEILTPPPLNIGGFEKPVVLLQSKIISETNSQRQANGNPSATLRTGLPALTENKELDETAAAKASDMFLNQYFEHVSPSGVGPGDLAQKYGYNYIVEGENLILGNFSSEKEVVQDWMNSPGHRANILNVRYTEIGVAVVKGTYKGETVWIGVQEFGLPLSACAQPDAKLKDEITPYQTRLDSLLTQLDESKKQIDSTNQDSPAYSKMVDDYNQLVGQYNSLAATTKDIIAQYNIQVNAFNDCVAGK
jgi:uncharacterized protein YkwD